MSDFVSILRELRRGSAVEEYTDTLRKLVAAVQDTGKAGELTIKITVKPAGKNIDALVVLDSPTAKIPEHDRAETMFFADNDNNLTREDPRQRSMDFEAANGLQTITTLGGIRND